MGRRRRQASFLPDIYVFPGGRVDAEDRRAASSGLTLDAETERLLRRPASSASPVALALAGLRETHEETGYLIARPACDGELECRPATPYWNALRAMNAMPDLARIAYLMRALTPTLSERRFNTRFFLVNADDVRGEPVADGELEDLHWLPVNAARRLPLIDVTRHALDCACQRRTAGRGAAAPTTVPFIHYVGERTRIDHV